MAFHILDEANRCLECKNPQCQQGCPVKTPIPEVIHLLKNNQLDKAGKVLFDNNPLTTICSLICNHEKQCEGHCVLGKKSYPVRFSAIENYISGAYAPFGRRLLDFDENPQGQDMYFNLYNNIWNTNFPMWYSDDTRFRFKIKRV